MSVLKHSAAAELEHNLVAGKSSNYIYSFEEKPKHYFTKKQDLFLLKSYSHDNNFNKHFF